MTDVAALRLAEENFQQAQLHSDVVGLDNLLHPDLIFVGPDGMLGDKSSDLDAHRSGLIRLDLLEPEDLVVRVADGVGVTVLTARLAGEFASQHFSARMRYTRAWGWSPKGWRVVAAHISTIESLPEDVQAATG